MTLRHATGSGETCAQRLPVSMACVWQRALCTRAKQPPGPESRRGPRRSSRPETLRAAPPRAGTSASRPWRSCDRSPHITLHSLTPRCRRVPSSRCRVAVMPLLRGTKQRPLYG